MKSIFLSWPVSGIAIAACLALSQVGWAQQAENGPQPSTAAAPAAPAPAPPLAAPWPTVGQMPAEHRAPGQAMLGVFVAPSETGKGVRVLNVEPNSPAAQAGLVAGDLITFLDKKEVNSPRDLTDYIRARQPGVKIDVAFSRGGEAKTVAATLADWHAVVRAPGALMPGVPGMPPGMGHGEHGTGMMMPMPPRGFSGQFSPRDQHLGTLLQQVLSEVQQLRREVQELRGQHGTATRMQGTIPQTERKK